MYQRPTLSYEDANSIVQNVLNQTCQQNQAPAGIACAVVGSLGELIAFGAQDNCAALPRKLAARKAYTSLILSRPTTEVKVAVDSGRINLGNLNDSEIAAMPGGAPIVVDGVLVGAIGISGLPPAEDAVIAEAAASRLVFNIDGLADKS